MNPKPLPFDAGNAGDLLKHGLIAEFVRWYCDQPECGDTLTFLDPFGGFPVRRAVPSVVEHVQKLRGSALFDAQPGISQNRYYGSSLLVRRATENAGKTAQVFASDKNEDTRKKLTDSRIDELKREGFKPQDGYSVLDCVNKNEMVLIDPFSDFLRNEKNKIIPKIDRISKQKNATVVLFVLNLNPENSVGKCYQALKQKHLSDAWVLSCPPIPLTESRIKGESKYHVDVLLVSPRLEDTNAKALHGRLRDYVKALTKLLGVEVCLHPRDCPL